MIINNSFFYWNKLQLLLMLMFDILILFLYQKNINFIYIQVILSNPSVILNLHMIFLFDQFP